MDLRYPVGSFESVHALNPVQRDACVNTIVSLPRKLREAVDGLSDAQLDTPYRPGGWTVRQVVHHIPDSHLNGYVRMKLGLTEDNPTIKPYDQDKWANLSDGKEGSIDVSLNLVEAVHGRWVRLLRSMKTADFERTLIHPEWGAVTLDFCVAQYAWHSKHHVAHITTLRDRNHW